ncbi:MAG: manganese efflux pump MntP family protein [Anaerovibrio sp.]|uniref:manganese efflux pump MntP n=1 Tax=Anaerovibrio sp. TaxID=1872532 RepID=UPI0026015997|nr:manganese efflux pump MntP family protein [Anaerovibrio sp.]MCR5175454.1 manganese efflux pump MntP family protein [Anaerovibrio sp.]
MGIIELLLLAVALSMDAFAVSICKGLAGENITLREGLICGIWFGVFQGIMPGIGYLIGSGFEALISVVAPWVAFVILALIGVNMIREAFQDDEGTIAGFGFKTMFIMAVATSIDALAVGITFVAVPVEIIAAEKLSNTLAAIVIIAVITFFISVAGVKLGNIFGMRFKSGSEVLGGIILVLIGIHSLFK